MSELGTLLRELETIAATQRQAESPANESSETRLARLRLGIASSLFAALQCKHAATAGHGLRVALTCSAWAKQMGMTEPDRDLLEVAALLHDIGVIGVPDHVLLKPGALDCDEAALMTQSRVMGLEILRHSCTATEILKIVEHVAAWYDGSRKGWSLQGEEIPLASRMIAVVEAFDAMTTDHVYRAAMSQERAMAELFHCAGRQFDPELVRKFAEFHEGDVSELRREVAGRWMRGLDPDLVNSYWELNCIPSHAAPPTIDVSFQAKLLDNMYDAVVFIDVAGKIKLWNHGAERLTGIAGATVCQQQWTPEILSMTDEKGHLIATDECPAISAVQSGVQSLRRLTIWGRMGRRVAVDSHAIPVIGQDGAIQGAILLLHDASSETSLEQRCQNLHEKATRDPLTQVANRAEYDRVHELFVEAHQEQKVPCSLIMCDLDRFKLVNDTYGHQAGDEAIQSVATLLKGACRPGDLVARYGGEEFVMLCADCDNAAAARRAEQVRKALAQMQQPKMEGRSVTASFGVTEIQPGDTPETMLRRADRALLMAKSKGRNVVVQLGSGGGEEPAEPKRDFVVRAVEQRDATDRASSRHARPPANDHRKTSRLRRRPSRGDPENRRRPRATGNRGEGRQPPPPPDRSAGGVPPQPPPGRRAGAKAGRRERRANRPHENHRRHQPAKGARPTPQRRRRARGRLLSSFRSYLMASPEEESPTPIGPLVRAKRILAPWLARK